MKVKGKSILLAAALGAALGAGALETGFLSKSAVMEAGKSGLTLVLDAIVSDAHACKPKCGGGGGGGSSKGGRQGNNGFGNGGGDGVPGRSGKQDRTR